jgi:hypothetical protein
MQEAENIRDRLAKLEALFARGSTAGERAAAGVAMERLQARIDRGGEEPREREIEVQYSLPDVWAVQLFVALCRKHGVKPYRYPRQRRTTVMVRVRKSAFEQKVMAEFEKLHGELMSYFGEMVNHLVDDVMKADGDDETLELRQIGR